jgi:hypothetical protein
MTPRPCWEMDSFLLRLFQRQVAAQSFAAILASETAQNALNPPAPGGTTDGEPVRLPPHQDAFWASVQSCLTAVANISKACWGQDGQHRKQRKPLRQSLGIKGDSPLKPLSTRNNFEHFDERLEVWFATGAHHRHVDRVIGPPNVIGGVADADMFRVFDTSSAEVVLWGERYPLKALMEEVTRIYPIAKAEADKPHWEPPRISGSVTWVAR